MQTPSAGPSLVASLRRPGWRGAVGLAIVVAAALLMPHPPAGLAASDWRALVLVLVAILFWACSILPEDLTGLAFFAAAMILAVAPAEAVFSGFAATAVWLVFGGLVIGAAAAKTGLDRAVAAPFRPLYRQSYARCVALTLLLATALAFLVPATMTRVLLLVPIVSALAQDLGYPKGSSGHAGLAVAAIFGSHFPAMVILPATVPTVALVGAADAFLNLPVTYGAFLWTHGPVLGLGKALLLFFVILRLFPADAPSPAVAAAETGGIDPARRRLAWLLAAALVLWTTDALHGIAAAWVALALAVLLVLPRLGVLEPGELQTRVNLRPAFYVAAILGIGGVLDHTGLGGRAVAALAASGWLAPGQDALNQIVVALAATLTVAVASMPGVAAILVPVAGDVAAATGLEVEAVLRALVLGYTTAFLPYQAPPLLIGLGLAGVSLARGALAMLLLAGLSLLLLWPLALLWWALVG